ncbi:MAG TPA: Rrf2 family transcriptional regulator, partial [Candidatus Polarisedimenticolaceae bacterium]|nr:Rrf2 family transcriptional regulator [Candidatus Polarisedimenticolaceae bacterium]
MNLTKSSRYALLAALEMAGAADHPVTAADVARRHGTPEAVVAKVLQRLVRAGLAVGTRGSNGGYRLARPASGITVLDVLRVFEEELA